MNGRLKDVVIEDVIYPDERTGLTKLGGFNVFADHGLLNAIGNVEGVLSVFNTFKNAEYSVFLDPRYDREYVKREIEAVCMCAEG